MRQRQVTVRNVCRDDITPVAIGFGAPTRVVANIGLSPDVNTIEEEISKAQAAVEIGVDVIADLTITSHVESMLRRLIREIKVPISTVPSYEAGVMAIKERGSIVRVRVNDMIRIIERQAGMGVDIMTIHAALTRDVLDLLKRSQRIIKIPSRGGSWIAGYMIQNEAENPLYENLDEILDIMKSYRVTLSLGSSARPGSIADGLDEIALAEISVMKNIVKRALDRGVQVIVEYGGHVRADVISLLVNLIKQLCFEVPLRTLITSTDVAAPYDHVAASISGALAAINSADMLVAITPAEHLGLPRFEDFLEGIMSFKVAAHIADIVKHDDLEKDRLMSVARSKRNWESMWKYALNGTKARQLHMKLQRELMESDHCTMCGSMCAHKIVEKFFDERSHKEES